uniref:Uncharacterized protein n=1 Tax=Arundo donax TaxID=35708 RepID=A0A0A9F430_ARUDO
MHSCYLLSLSHPFHLSRCSMNKARMMGLGVAEMHMHTCFGHPYLPLILKILLFL